MEPSERLLRMYEDLANRYARQGESRLRDHCLVLAADAALKAELPDQAERLRKRLLLTNPHHLLRPFTSMAEAMQSDDVREYVIDLRRRYPPEIVDKMLRDVPAKSETFDLGVAQPAPPTTEEPLALPAKKSRREPQEAESATLMLEPADAPLPPRRILIALLLCTLSLGVMVIGLVLALGGPWLQ